MQIGEVIRKYRKEKNMTQEEMANRLGVTAPAVNKWENGNSLPDIALLAPIARLLHISLDMLLSYEEELTDTEINSLIQEMDDKLKKESYDEVFQWATDKLTEYPNCEKLILQVAAVLDANRLFKDVPEKEQYDEYIKNCYVRVLESKDEKVRYSAAESLFGLYMRKEQYGKAEEYLEYFSMQNPERKRKQAFLYSKTNRIFEAYKTYEELLFSGYQMMSGVLHGMYMMAMEENDRDKARYLVEKQQQLSRLFEMGEYHAVSAGLDLATAEQDTEETLKIMKRMMENLEDINGFSKSPLYEHMTWKEARPEFMEELKQNLLMCFRDEESYGWLKEDARWKELVGEL